MSDVLFLLLAPTGAFGRVPASLLGASTCDLLGPAPAEDGADLLSVFLPLREETEASAGLLPVASARGFAANEETLADTACPEEDGPGDPI